MTAPFFIVEILPSRLKVAETLSKFTFLECPFFKFFGLLCPTCGLGCSLCAAFLLEFKTSLPYHPGGLAILFILYLTLICLWIRPQRLRDFRLKMRGKRARGPFFYFSLYPMGCDEKY
jgi:hypothetical protein